MACGGSTAAPAGVSGAAALLVVHAEGHEARVGGVARDGRRASHVRRRVRESGQGCHILIFE